MPARGGSKRIPRKNIKNFHGLPILTQTLQKIHSFNYFDRFIVSSEDNEILNIAAELNFVEVPFKRPKKLATDHVNTKEVILHLLDKLGTAIEENDYIFCIYPTAVLIEKEYLLQAEQLLKNSPEAFIATAMRYPHPVERAFTLGNTGELLDINSHYRQKRTQDFSEKYYDAGMFYGATKKTWTAESPILGLNTKFIKLPAFAMIDIDDESDWTLLEKIWANRIE